LNGLEENIFKNRGRLSEPEGELDSAKTATAPDHQTHALVQGFRLSAFHFGWIQLIQ
jgi:hypothetical protein